MKSQSEIQAFVTAVRYCYVIAIAKCKRRAILKIRLLIVGVQSWKPDS